MVLHDCSIDIYIELINIHVLLVSSISLEACPLTDAISVIGLLRQV